MNFSKITLQQRLLEIVLTSAILDLKWPHDQRWIHARDTSIGLFRVMSCMCCVPINTIIEPFELRI